MSVDEQRLIDQIERAFAGVTLDDGISLNMTEYNDSGGLRPEFKERAFEDERDDWRAIPDETLERFTVTFSFTDLKGFRFYIPAYMIWTVRNHRRSVSIISDHTIFSIDPSHYLFESIPFLRWFTADQVSAMVGFLSCFADQGDEDARGNLVKIRNAQLADADSWSKSGV